MEINKRRYYVARVNLNNGEIQYISVTTYSHLPIATDLIDDVAGYDDRAIAVKVANLLNAMKDAVNAPHEYFDVIRDEKTIANKKNLSEQAKEWLDKSNGAEETEEQPPEEPPTEEGTTE